MQLNVDMRQPVPQSAGSAESSHPWVLGRITVEDPARPSLEGRPYSFNSECECPDDCLRDHENE